MHTFLLPFLAYFCGDLGVFFSEPYLEDYAGSEVKKLGEQIIAKYLEEVDNKTRKNATIKRLQKIKEGTRDLYF